MTTTPLSIYEIISRSGNESLGTLSILHQWGTEDEAKPFSTPKDELPDHFDILGYISEENKEVLVDFYTAFHELGVVTFDIKFKLVEKWNLPTSDTRAGDLNFSNYPDKGFIWSIDLYDQTIK